MKRLVIATAMLLTTSAMASAQEKVEVPQEALQWMASLVGEWEAEGTVNGQETKGLHSARWAPGEHCIQFTQHWTGAINGHSAGIGGWAPDQKRYVEHWYVSNGSCRTHWYSLSKEKDVRVGGLTQIDKEGKPSSAKITLEQRPAEWKLVATGEQDGEKTELTFRKIN